MDFIVSKSISILNFESETRVAYESAAHKIQYINHFRNLSKL